MFPNLMSFSTNDYRTPINSLISYSLYTLQLRTNSVTLTYNGPLFRIIIVIYFLSPLTNTSPFKSDPNFDVTFIYYQFMIHKDNLN